MIKSSRTPKATRLILSGSVSPLLLYLQEMLADWGRDEVKTEALEEGLECTLSVFSFSG